MKIVDISRDYFSDNPEALKRFEEMFTGPRYF